MRKNSKINWLLLFLIVISFSSFFLTGCSGSAETVGEINISQQEQLECPRGLNHDPAPGVCPLYRDENKDGYCDFE